MSEIKNSELDQYGAAEPFEQQQFLALKGLTLFLLYIMQSIVLVHHDVSKVHSQSRIPSYIACTDLLLMNHDRIPKTTAKSYTDKTGRI